MITHEGLLDEIEKVQDAISKCSGRPETTKKLSQKLNILNDLEERGDF